LRFTLEGFYKGYSNVAVSEKDGISLANLGTDFTALSNEAVKKMEKVKHIALSFLYRKN